MLESPHPKYENKLTLKIYRHTECKHSCLYSLHISPAFVTAVLSNDAREPSQDSLWIRVFEEIICANNFSSMRRRKLFSRSSLRSFPDLLSPYKIFILMLFFIFKSKFVYFPLTQIVFIKLCKWSKEILFSIVW